MKRSIVASLAIALLLLSAGAPGQEKPRIRAFLVGAGAYQNPDAWSPLAGPTKDVERLRKTLVERFSTPSEQVTVLAEAAATRGGIEQGLLSLVQAAQPGETLIFYYAGHGFAVPNREPVADAAGFEKQDPEEDGMDECLVAIDCPKPDDPTFADKVVRDDFFEEILAQGVRKVRPDGGGEGSVLFIFDSCHSGTISRGAKALEKVERTNLAYRAGAAPPKPTTNAPAVVEASRHGAGDRGWVVLSACGARQTAKEDPSHGGDFTNALITALEDPRLGPDSTYQELIRMVGSNPYFYDQNPVAEGDRAMLVLGGSARPREAAISVLSAFDKTVTLDRGKLLGVTPGSKIALYKVGAKSAEDKARFLTTATVQEPGTDLYRASATVEGGDVKDLASAVGWVSEQNFGQVELSVFFDAAAESLAPLTEDPVVKKVARGADATVLAWNEGGKLRLERASGGGVLLAPTDDPTLVRRALRGEARRQYLTRMVNSPQELEVGLQSGRFTSGTISSFAASDQQPGSDGLLTFGQGEQALMSITNRSAAPLFISVLNFTPDGGVKVLYPYGVEVNKLLAPGQTLAVDLSFEGGGGQEGFKVIGTSQEVDLLFLESQGKERSAEQPEATLQSPFGQLMGSVMSGTRAGRPTIAQPSGYVAKEILWVNLK
jgi:hypothetical protein